MTWPRVLCRCGQMDREAAITEATADTQGRLRLAEAQLAKAQQERDRAVDAQNRAEAEAAVRPTHEPRPRLAWRTYVALANVGVPLSPAPPGHACCKGGGGEGSEGQCRGG